MPSSSRTASHIRGHVVCVYPSASLMCSSGMPVTDFVEMYDLTQDAAQLYIEY